MQTPTMTWSDSKPSHVPHSTQKMWFSHKVSDLELWYLLIHGLFEELILGLLRRPLATANLML